ncbi:hypothetical protein HDU79_008362 [Rhizoclosmatium sp. JEL0117]|nr:hypothetical protein HDU79_008362 [Rhizoclosmatium sp. JEL0117]
MRPSFPTLTWPNHYSLATGLYPDSHGIVGNIFHDTRTNRTFDYMDMEGQRNSEWWGGEPIWITAEKSGITTANCMWPGSTAEIKHTRPSLYREWDWRVSHEQRIDIAVEWLALPPSKRPLFVAVYLGDVDHAGHMYGPDSPQVNTELTNLDNSIAKLIAGVERISKRAWYKSVNIIVVSDHGMGEGNTLSKFVFLDDFVDSTKFTIVDDVAVHIFPTNDQDMESLYQTWKSASLASGHWNIWKKEEIPAEYHYSTNARIAPLIAVPDPGWAVSSRSSNKILSKPFELKGMHGYNNSHPDMQAIFVAAGPAFKPVTQPIKPFENIEIYNLIARVMGLKQTVVNNGTVGASLFDGYLH